MVKITGDKEFLAKLQRIRGPEMERALGRALFAAGDLIREHAQGSIMRDGISMDKHVPSRPGEPPKNNTQVLHNNIETVQIEPLLVEVSSNATYSASLEFGTSRMEPRPFMRPALQAKENEAKALIRRAVDHVIKGGGIR